MYMEFTASKDTYITNKIITPSVRAIDANVGHATTIDLFKLYTETLFTGESNPIELSRGLIFFELADISSSLSGKTDFSHSSFKTVLKLHDVQGNQVAPNDFNLAVFALSQSFDEGKGRDISSFSFLDRTNWVTASLTTAGNIPWNSTGAFSSGTLGANNIDIIEDGVIGGTSTYLVKSQRFSSPSQNLEIDVTNIVSASMTGILPNHGFLIAYSGSQEHDHETRFVKRFASRHTRNPYIRPKLIVEYDDSKVDNNQNFEFNVTGSLFLENFSRGAIANILSGSANTEVKGNNCILLKLHTGSYEKYLTGSQSTISGVSQTGQYLATFAIDRYLSASVTAEETLGDFIAASGSVVFGQEWLSLDENISYFTGSLKISAQNRTHGTNAKKFRFALTNLRQKYKPSDRPRLEVFITDMMAERKSVRIPIQAQSELVTNLFYQIRDAYNGKILTPFTRTNNITRVSNDKLGMYFIPSLSHLPKGRSYTVDFMTVINGIETQYIENGVFRIE